MSTGFLPYRIEQVKTWSEDLRTIILDHVPAPFEAGQFFQLSLPGRGPTEKRSYSAASAPGQKLEFFVSRVPHGSLTPDLFRQEVGQEILVDPVPLGFFNLNEVPEAKRLWLVATGTGLGPYISMLRTPGLLSRFDQVIVVHGVRTIEHLAYADELLEHAAAGDFTYIPLVSREAPPKGGLSGRITSALESGALEESAGARFDTESHMLLCGNPQMIEDTAALLKARGFKKHKRREAGHFNFEKYWQ
jgi:ferredoxin/flavodoxin---NADP+ reductase